MDGMDNDGDSVVDCADSDCANQSCGTGCVCRNLLKAETLCTDGVDNDGDMRTDCLDGPDCDGTSCGAGCVCTGGAKREQNCTDRQDNDMDGLRDCADTMDCTGAGNLCGNGTTEASTLCNDTIDNDNDGDRDCEDTGCEGQACGAGCTCRNQGRSESACGDGADNDGDTLIDCADTDCVGTAPETNCSDGRDDNCNGQVDCGDPGCTGNGACTALPYGRACTASSQCASNFCRTEASSGWPSGACTGPDNGCTLDAGVSYGCLSGGACTQDVWGRFCRQQCSGSTGCRAGYACHQNLDEDWEGPRTCITLCTGDADCNRGLGANYGCNLFSRRCDSKNRNLGKYGASCSNNNACESFTCLSDRGGYCGGLCAKGGSCGNDGVCGNDGTNDGTGRCFDACASASECTRGAPYTCRAAPYGGGGGGQVCYCSRYGEPCSDAADCCNPSPFGFPPTCAFGACTF